ncbi:MAG: single-stranded DNA-binding protein, partial [Vitreoscilla sp.]|nr:single-stranded DNA-binding protein [Vitreoscilla sp.]
MANVQVIQRHAHLAGAVRLEFVNGQEGKMPKAVLTAISNTRRANRGGEGENREEESTAIHWTLWGKAAENAAQYLTKGSHVNVVGHVRNNPFIGADGQTVYAMEFTADEVD